MKDRVTQLERTMAKSKNISLFLYPDAYQCMGLASPFVSATVLGHRTWGSLWAT
jgi:hypothetical protein